MQFTLTINMDNAAFAADAVCELRSILESVPEAVERRVTNGSIYLGAGDCGNLYDSNGNRVGYWQIE